MKNTTENNRARYATDKSHTPSPEEIRRMTAEIRKGWSKKEHLKRAGIARSFIYPHVWIEPSLRISRSANQSL